MKSSTMLLQFRCFGPFCCFENTAIVDCHVKTILLLCLIVVRCILDLGYASVIFLLNISP